MVASHLTKAADRSANHVVIIIEVITMAARDFAVAITTAAQAQVVVAAIALDAEETNNA